MKNIEFRGKVRIPGMADGEEFDGYQNGDWVTGFVNVEYQKTFICWKDYDAIGEGVGDQDRKFPVDPKTVSQFTGLEDKNRTKIYEGDIVVLNDARIYQVMSSIEFNTPWNTRYLCTLYNPDYKQHFLNIFCLEGKSMEARWNIYDKPDFWDFND